MKWFFSAPFKVFREVSFLLTSYRSIKGSNMIIVTGSNQLFDFFGGPFHFPYNLLKWSVLAKLSGSKLAFLSVGAGPFESRLGRYFAHWALALSDYVSFRDQGSMHLANSIGFTRGSKVYPDLAHSLNISHVHAESIAKGRGVVVGVNAMPIYHPRYWPLSDVYKYRNYVEQLSEVTLGLLRRNHRVRFFGTQFLDLCVAKDVLAVLETRGIKDLDWDELISRSDSVDQLMSNILSFDVVIATRFHGVVLSLLAGKPTLAICYHRKIAEVMAEFGMTDCAFRVRDFVADNFLRKFDDVLRMAAAVSAKIHHDEEIRKAKLEKQYRQICSVIRSNLNCAKV